MDENNQYDNAMTKPLLKGSIKNSKNILIIEDKIGHLFVVDIKFDEKRATEKHLLFNEIHTPIFEKKKLLPPIERSVIQLLDAMRLNDKGLLNSYKTTAKTHSTMEETFFIHLCAEHIHFVN